MALLGVLAFLAFVLAWNWWTGARYFKMLRRSILSRKSN